MSTTSSWRRCCSRPAASRSPARSRRRSAGLSEPGGAPRVGGAAVARRDRRQVVAAETCDRVLRAAAARIVSTSRSRFEADRRHGRRPLPPLPRDARDGASPARAAGRRCEVPGHAGRGSCRHVARRRGVHGAPDRRLRCGRLLGAHLIPADLLRLMLEPRDASGRIRLWRRWIEGSRIRTVVASFDGAVAGLGRRMRGGSRIPMVQRGFRAAPSRLVEGE